MRKVLDIRRLKVIVIVACVAALAIACQWDRTVYYHYEPVPEDWSAGDSIIFNLPVLDSAGHYLVSVEWRYTDAYPYRSLRLLVENNLTDSLQWDSDTVTCFLRDEQGVACGKGISAMYQYALPLGEYVSDGSGRALIRIVNCTHMPSFEGICDVGIKIERH